MSQDRSRSDRIDIHLLERVSRVPHERVWIGSDVGRKLFVGWCCTSSDVVCEELEFLPQATANHRVVAIYSHRDCLTVVNLFEDEIVDQAR